MADVQLEHGFLRLATELAEAFAAARITGRHHQVVWALLRLTYGWNKRADRISVAQLAALTGISRQQCGDMITDLERWRIVTVERQGRGRTSVLSIQKDHEKWAVGDTVHAVRVRRGKQLSRQSGTVSKATTVPAERDRVSRQSGTEVSRQSGHSIDKKDIPQKHQNQSGAGSLRVDPSGPDPDRITRADLDSDERCDQLLEHARKRGWGVQAEGERSRWYGDKGRVAWFEMRSYVLRKEVEFDDVCAVFAECARSGLFRGNGTDLYEARAVVAMLDASKPIDPRVDVLLDRVLQ